MRRRRQLRPSLRPADDPRLPPVAVVDRKGSLREFWMTRVAQAVHDVYAGAPLLKLPEDLRVYEHLLWASAPQVVIELGAAGGGSSLWFRDRLRTLAAYRRISDPLVVTVELEPSRTIDELDSADPDWRSSIQLVTGDVCDPATALQVRDIVPPGARVLVSEDSAHVYETTWSALTHFSPFVKPDGYFVVEDGCGDIEELRLEEAWPRGMLRALHDWLATEQGRSFRVRPDLELYGITTNVEGYLQRVR